MLDTLTPEQVMHCNTEEDCTQLVKLLPPMEAAILDWAINLMADVVQHETYNKMNARNIAMVFAPNMTQVCACVCVCGKLINCTLFYLVNHNCRLIQLHKNSILKSDDHSSLSIEIAKSQLWVLL